MSIISSTGQIYTIISNDAVLDASSTAVFGIVFSASPHACYISFQSPPSPTLNSSASWVCQNCLRSLFSFYLTAIASSGITTTSKQSQNWDVTSRNHCSSAQYRLAVIISSVCYIYTVSNKSSKIHQTLHRSCVLEFSSCNDQPFSTCHRKTESFLKGRLLSMHKFWSSL